MIEFQDVTKKYGRIAALAGVSFKIDTGEFVFMIGPSGAGKSTILKLILREISPTSGTIQIGGVDIKEIAKKKVCNFRRRIGVVFQDFKLISDQTVFENVALTLKICGTKEAQISAKVMEVLKLVGLDERADYFPSQLAGGELQRVCLARAVVSEPEILLADEPTGNLDLQTGWQIMELIKKINKAGKTVIMATHNFEIVNKMKERVISVSKGRLMSDQEKGEYSQLPKNEALD